MRPISLVLVALLAGLVSAPARPAHGEACDDLRAEVEALRGVVSDLAAQVARTRPGVHSFSLPQALTFAGQRVPLEQWDVAERLEREFYVTLADPAQVVLWLKRSARYFPYIERRLREAGLPDDMKYVAVAESALRPRAYSWARASGIWQFVDGTARRYGLRVSAAWDERRDPERATAAAIAYLRDLHARFGNWPLALAGYNAGEHRVATAIREQGVSEYYQLALPTETERYVFRILAAKLILEAPDHYGFQVPPGERYAPHTTETVTVKVTRSLPVRELATAAGSFYREIRVLNPAIAGDRLPRGTYHVRIPGGRRAQFEAAWSAVQRAMAARTPRRVTYRVRPGDTLADIARRFGVSVEALRAANAAARRAYLRPGDVLVIRAGMAD